MIRSKGFYKYAWDPIIGCMNRCPYCYAAKRIEDFENVKFYPKTLIEPSQVEPCTIFVNHLADIMGDWVPEKWIVKVIEVCISLPDHTFIWMTKNPKRYKEFIFPDNCILGITIESPDKWFRADIMKELNYRKMCSVEPILGSFKGYDFSQFELVVVGEMDGKKGNHKLYRTVKHKNVFRKA